MSCPPIAELLSKRHPHPKQKGLKVVNTPPGYDRGFNMQSPSHELVTPSNRLNPVGINIVGLYVEAMAAQVPPLRQSPSSPVANSTGTTSPQTTGSHNIRGGTITGCGMVTIGNTSAGGFNRSTPTLKSHTFSELRILHSKNLHFGNTGPGSEGHDISKPEVQGVAAVHIGDFSSIGVKEKSFHLANQGTRA